VWFVPEEKGGIRWYSDTLWKELAPHAPPGSLSLTRVTAEELRKISPSLIHVQHEYGCFGSKIPGLYTFPKWLREVRASCPDTKIVATAHSVIREGYRYPVVGRGWQMPARMAANLAMPLLVRWWNRSTWGRLDGAVVQQAMYVQTLKNSGCPVVREIPLFVPEIHQVDCAESSTILVFGFFSPEKAQDVAIRAMLDLPSETRLVLAGGVRREEDRGYFGKCQALIRELGLESRVQITGFVADQDLDRYYKDAAVILLPFRESTGSGSLVQAFARGKPVLASDLAVNREIVERVPGSLRFFQSENAKDCASQLKLLLEDASARRALSEQGLVYAERFSVPNSVRAHLDFYTELLEKD
jgi:glycosyltransferase involved in cell wall biosynthesis